MKTVSFVNDGYLDATSIITFGVNAKETDSAIGYFGTGLKYAIAVILREGCSISIYSGDEEYHFKTEEKEIRGKKFNLICMNGQQLGFTTELGKNWKMWQAFRELYCNALDENGECFGEKKEHEQDKTTVIVEGSKFYDAFLDKNSIILDTPCYEPHWETDIHSGSSKTVFYKKIRIYEMPLPTLYTYNIKETLGITEDRTAASFGQVCSRIADAVVRTSNKQLIEDVLVCDSNYFEHKLDLTDAYDRPSEDFLEEVERLKFHPRLNKTALRVLAKYRKRGDPKPAELTKVQEKQLSKATEFCIKLGYNVNNYPIVVTDDLTGGRMGLAEKGIIYIALDAFGMGTKYVAATLIEEYLHLKTGFGDLTRELQNHLFNDLVTFGERIFGEPL